MDRIEIVIKDNIPIVTLKGLILMKQALGREKDRKDIELIYNFMSKE